MTWTCAACGATFDRWATAQRHANEAHHGARISADVPAKKPSTVKRPPPAPLQIDGQVLMNMMAKALVDSPATCQLLIGMGVLERRDVPAKRP